jgi:hypothetical protein
MRQDGRMSDDSTNADFVGGPNGVYVNQVRVVYHSIDRPSSARPSATVVLIADAGMPIDRELLRVEIEQLHYDRTDPTHPVHESFVSEERLRNVSWGASGAVLDLIMQVPAEVVYGIIGSAAYAGLLAVRDRIRDARGPAWRTRPLDGLTAQRRATEMAEAAWSDLHGTNLTVLSCNLADDTATVVLRAADGSTITAQPTMTDGDAVGPITRAYPEE